MLHDNTVVELRQQLHKAATHIRQLARDKCVLIEVGNRLRAELLRNGNCIASYNCRISPIFKVCILFWCLSFLFSYFKGRIEWIELIRFQTLYLELNQLKLLNVIYL